MCLHHIEKFPIKDHVGWKVLYKDGMKYFTPMRHTPEPILRGKVIKRWNIEDITAGSGERYKSGFHIFKIRKDASAYKMSDEIVKKVKFGTVITTGYQSRCRVIVAKTITVL